MKIAWIYPNKKTCGISIYSKRFTDALKAYVDIVTIDICETFTSQIISKINSCDIAHIQYETILFDKNGKNIYSELCSKISKPSIATLHEVYDTPPGVFPRNMIRGNFIMKNIKKIIYDIRHPIQNLYRRHTKNGFYVDNILVHYPFQKDILVSQGINLGNIDVINHPLAKRNTPNGISFTNNNTNDSPLRLGSTGFINPNYNYNLLFQTLDLLDIPWNFTWIGGLRRKEDNFLLGEINKKIKNRNWQNRFFITGWVSEPEQTEQLCKLDCYLAMFSNRSTSGSLLEAISTKRMIVASDLPLTNAINADNHVLVTSAPHAADVCNKIKQIIGDASLRSRLTANISDFIEQHTYQKMAERLFQYYQRNVIK